MTKEEAIRIISGEVLGTTEQTHEAVAMAVEALSAQSQQVTGKLNSDCISRRDAIDALEWKWAGKAAIDAIKNLPSAQQSRLENAIHGKSPEEIYEFISWLFLGYAMQFTDSRHAVINWLKGESDDESGSD